MRFRHIGSGLAAITLALGVSGTALAGQPQVYTWSNSVDTEYFDCGSFVAHGVWNVSHRLTFFLDAGGTAVRDIEVIEFAGAFVNPDTGASIPDSGRITFFDTLDAKGDYLTTMSNVVRHNAYLHSAGRTDFQTGAYHGMDAFDAGVAAACAALGA
ncbi:MAG: hypothetical protein HY264_02885 [Chloroflexi bacterium]|nr:hypothetical protein [Chloroflexota bacterium]